MTNVHRLPIWLGGKLCASWNTRVVAKKSQGRETSRKIRFMRGLPQRDALCPRLFTLCLNPVAWRLRATKGYRLSKPIGVKVTDLLYIDDVEVFASSERKLNRVLKETRGAMQDVGLHWNKKKCSVVQVKRGAQVLDEYEDGRESYHHGSWGRKTLQIPGGARERSTGRTAGPSVCG